MKYKKVILVNPYPGKNIGGLNESTIYPPLGLVYIASVLRMHNVQVKILEANILKLDNAQVVNFLCKENPDLAGISLNIFTANAGINLSQRIKEVTNFDVCLGGPFPSAIPEDILKKSKADILVIGEGERSIVDICNGELLSEIQGIAWKRDGVVIVNESAELIGDLDTLPMPAYDLLPPFGLYRARIRKSPMAPIFTSRGCPSHCTFCNHNVFGKRFRAFSPGRVISEIELLISKYGIKQLDILDDNFTFDMRRAEEILDLILERKFNIRINLQNGMRVDNLNPSIVKKMKKAGVFKVGIGCESADIPTLKEIKKGVDLAKIRQAVQWFSHNKIISYLFFIFGFPNDTRETIMRTIDFAIEVNPTTAVFSLLIPFPGTEIHSLLKKQSMLKDGITDGVMTGFFGRRLYHSCRYLTEDDVVALQSLAYRKFYFRPNKIIEQIRQIRSFAELRWLFNIISARLQHGAGK